MRLVGHNNSGNLGWELEITEDYKRIECRRDRDIRIDERGEQKKEKKNSRRKASCAVIESLPCESNAIQIRFIKMIGCQLSYTRRTPAYPLIQPFANSPCVQILMAVG